MALPLPPKSACTPADAPVVNGLLDSCIAYRPTATSTYQFYDEIDAWLGPWGASGYPIGYGKKYNILFTTNPPLNRDLNWGKKWVERTTVYLQETLKTYLVGRVGAGSIATLTEQELRDVAFASHPDVYRRAGLFDVIDHSPELLLVILVIPYEQYNPTNPNFVATILQIVRTLTGAKFVELLQAGIGSTVRSLPPTILIRFLWDLAAGRIPGVPPLPPGARDDAFADKLGAFGGFINIFES